jgi:Uma2 family endonuclease
VAMRTAVNDKIFSLEEYIQHELHAERRSEFINGQLYPMPGEKAINNKIAFLLSIILYNWLNENGYEIFNHDIKVSIPNENKYYYPDVFATKETPTQANDYIKSEPEIIIEVVSPSSQVSDYVDKYIDYTKIPSLQYYVIVEPETLLITVYQRGDANTWEIFKYTKKEEMVNLDKLGISFLMSDVYKK